MAIEYSMEVSGDTLIVKVWGFDEGFEEAAAYNKAVESAAASAGCSRILCDERELEYRLNVTDTYRLGEYASEIARRFDKIAIVTVEGDEEIMRFWEDVTFNRGINVRVFFSEKEAVAWLSAPVRS
jgi:hypothetical protein